MRGKIRKKPSGCPRTKKKFCQNRGLPPPLTCNAAPFTTSPLGRKKLVEAKRSMICMTTAASNGGNASHNRKGVKKWARKQKKRPTQGRPGAREREIGGVEFSGPSRDDGIRKIK